MKRQMFIQDANGDSRLEWETKDPKSVALAEKIFDDLMKRKYRAFREQPDGTGGGVQKEFDPETNTIMVAPITAG